MLETKTLRHREVKSPNQEGRLRRPQGSDRPLEQRGVTSHPEPQLQRIAPGCQEAHLAETQNLRGKIHLHAIRSSSWQGEHMGADAREGKQWAQGQKDSAAESNREPGCLADQSLGFPWVPDSFRDHRWKLEVTKVPKI